jgi:hypothetical protein
MAETHDWGWIALATAGGLGAGIGAYLLLRGGRDLGGHRCNADGQCVGLSVRVVNGTIVATAHPQGFANPVFQFWFRPPNGDVTPWTNQGFTQQNGWVSGGPYRAVASVSIPALVHGPYQVIVYAQEAANLQNPTIVSAEAQAYDPQVEAVSDTWQVTA